MKYQIVTKSIDEYWIINEKKKSMIICSCETKQHAQMICDALNALYELKIYLKENKSLLIE